MALILSVAAPVWAQSPDLLDRAPAPVIAAGDVTANSAVLWVQAERAGTVVVELAAPEGSGEPPQRFQTEVAAGSEFTAKIKIDGLEPDGPVCSVGVPRCCAEPELRSDQVPE